MNKIFYEIILVIILIIINGFFAGAEDQNYTTISGLLLDKLEKIPEEGITTTVENIEFTIKEKNDRMIKLLTVRKFN